MAYDLTEFDSIPWTEADEARPDVNAPERPEKLSERGERVLKGNARLRETWDGTRDGYSSDSERAYALAYHAGHAGLSVEDATWLLCDLYSRPGKKKLHQTKLQKTLRAWAKGREEAQREDVDHGEETTVDAAAEVPGPGTRGKLEKRQEEIQPYEVLPGPEFMRTSFAGAVRLVPSLGLTEVGVGLLTGAGGHGKSVCGLNLALHWTGFPLPLGQAMPAARPLRVLVFQVEDAPGMVQERLRMMLAGAEIPENIILFTRREPMRFGGPKGRPLDGALKRLGVTLSRHALVDVVLFDPLVYLHEAEENSSSEMMRWLVPLREVCRQAGAALLVVHHAGWAPDGDDARGRGTTALRAWADFELALREQSKNGPNLYRLNLVKTNFAPRWKEPLTLELDKETLVFRPVDEAETLCSTAALVAWMSEELNGVWTGKRLDFYAEVSKRFGCSDRTARDATASAIREKKLTDHGQRKPLEVVANSQAAFL